jgi:hypothetical protein
MVKCGVLFQVRAEFLSTIYMTSGFKGLNKNTLYNIFTKKNLKEGAGCKVFHQK